MADVGIKVVFDDSQVLNGTNNIIRLSEEMKKAQDGVNSSIQTGMEKNKKALEGHEKAVEDVVDATKKMSNEQKEAQKTLEASAKQVKIFGRSVDDIKGIFSKWIVQLKATRTAILANATAMQVFKRALISTGIGALVVALGSLVAYLTQTQRGLDFVSRTMEGLKSILGNVTDAFINIGDGIVKLFQGKPRDALTSFKQSFQEIKNIGEDINIATGLEKASQVLRDQQIELQKEISKTRKEIDELRLASTDQSKSVQERADLIQKATQLETGLIQKRLELANEEIRIEEERQKLSESTAVDAQKLADLISTRDNIERESLQLKRRLTNELNSLINKSNAEQKTAQAERLKQLEEEAKKIEELKTQYKDYIDQLNSAIQEIELDKLSPVQRLIAERDIARKVLEDQKKLAIETARALNLPTDELEQKFQVLFDNLDTELEVKVKELRIDQDQLEREVPKIERLIEQKFDPPTLTVQIEPEPTLNPTKLQGFFEDVSSLLSSDEFNVGLDSAFQLAELTGTIIDGQIQKYEDLANARQKQIDQLRADLEFEQELYKDGLANNVGTKQAELDSLLSEQESYNEKANELRKRQIQIELAQSISQQVASTGVAIAEVFKAHAGIPFVGIGLAIGFVATMIKTIASAKQQISALSKLYTGAERLGDYTGYVYQGGQSDTTNRGFAVIDATTGRDTRVRLGGNEMIVSEGTTRLIGSIVQEVEKRPSLGYALRKWYQTLDSQGAIRERANVVTALPPIIQQSLSQKEMEKVMERALQKHFENYKTYKDGIEDLTFIPDAPGKLIKRTGTTKRTVIHR